MSMAYHAIMPRLPPYNIIKQMLGFAELGGASVENFGDGRKLWCGILLSAGKGPFPSPLAEPLRYSGISSRVII